LSESIRKIFESPASTIAQIHKQYPAVMKTFSDARIFLKVHAMDLRITLSIVFLVVAAWMIIRIARQRGYSSAARVWTGAFVILTLNQMLSGFINYWVANKWSLDKLIISSDLRSMMTVELGMAYDAFALYFGFFLLILIGAFLAQRHGRLALLLPLGYLIPTVVLGKFDYDWGMPYFLLSISIIVIVYRVLVSIVAPVWIVRSANDHAQKRAGMTGLLAAVGILVMAHIVYIVFWMMPFGGELNILNIYYYLSPELITLAGIGLAVSLYKPVACPQTEARLAQADSKT
jgi:hypothetical protein